MSNLILSQLRPSTSTRSISTTLIRCFNSASSSTLQQQQELSSSSSTSSTSSPSNSPPPTFSAAPIPPISYSLDSPITLHPPTHGIHVATLHLRSYGPLLRSLDFFSSFSLRVASCLSIPTSGIASLPTRINLWTVPKGPFVHKKSQENFERRTHKRVIKVWDSNPEVVERWLTFLRIHAMEGVGMRVELFSYHPLNYSTKMLENAQSQRRQSPTHPSESAAPSTSTPTTSSDSSKSTSQSSQLPSPETISAEQAVKNLADGIMKDEMKDLGEVKEEVKA